LVQQFLKEIGCMIPPSPLMSANSKETDYVFHLHTYSFQGTKVWDEKYKIMKLEDGLRVAAFGQPLDGEFTKKEKEKLEELLKKVQAPGYKYK
jgi:hypothetical protein